MPQLQMEQLRIWNEEYRAGNPTVSDEQFDSVLASVQSKLDPASYLQFRTSLMESGGDIVHDYVIGSLRKCNYGTGEFQEFLASEFRSRVILQVAAKLDGMSYTAKYLNGVLIQCATRGDGKTGEDITAPARYILPNMLPITGLLEIRGEFVIPKQACATLGYKNARNGVVGLMKKEEILPERLMHVRAPVYQILNSVEGRQAQYEELEKLGFEVPAYDLFTSGDENIEERLKEVLEDLQENHEYLVDGLVISADYHQHENVALPKSMIAFKVNRDFVETEVIGMTIETSKEGRLKGTASVTPVDINGTTVSNVSIYNFKYVDENKIGKGAKVIITKAGEIIPKITEVLEGGYVDFEDNWKYCPSCGSRTERDGVDMRCTSTPHMCPAQNVKSVTHFLKNLDILGASEVSLEKWGITTVAQCLTFSPIDKNGEKFKDNFAAKVFSTSKEELFGALNWNGVGTRVWEKIFAVAEFDYVIARAVAGLPLGVDVEGVGELVWAKVVEYAGVNLLTVNEIVGDTRYNFVEVVKEDNHGGSVSGKSFCCTGTLSAPRKEIEAAIKAAGGVIKSVSKNLDYLVAGEKAGSKIAKAEKAGVAIITEEQLMEMIG